MNDYEFTPFCEVSNAIYAVTDINTTSWSSLWDSQSSSLNDYNDYEYSYARGMYESNDIVPFICNSAFSNSTVKPCVCQAGKQCLKQFDYESILIFILWTNNNGNKEKYVESSSYCLDAPYYDMNDMNDMLINSVYDW